MSNLKFDPLEVYKWLCTNKFLEGENSRTLTQHFFDLVHEVNRHNNLPAIVKQELVLPATPAEWELRFMNLIADAQVPTRLEDSRGNPYYANKFSIEGLKVFQKAMKSGVDYQVLVKSVMLYYKSSVKFKKAIGNYFKDGDWKTDYNALMDSAEKGKDAIADHINKEIHDGTRGNYKLG